MVKKKCRNLHGINGRTETLGYPNERLSHLWKDRVMHAPIYSQVVIVFVGTSAQHCTSLLNASSLGKTKLACIEQLDGTGGGELCASGTTTTSRLCLWHCVTLEKIYMNARKTTPPNKYSTLRT